jgi:hypothetical protein
MSVLWGLLKKIFEIGTHEWGATSFLLDGVWDNNLHAISPQTMEAAAQGMYLDIDAGRAVFSCIPVITSLFLLQTKAAYDKALQDLKGAGVVLVPMDMHVLTELSERIMPDESLYTYEMPRELSRCPTHA